MKMAKASEADLDMAMELCGAIDVLGQRFLPSMPEAIEELGADDDREPFDRDDDAQCGRALRYLLEVADRASLMRVVWGCAVMLDPRNELVDPDADTIEHHPRVEALCARVAEMEAKAQRYDFVRQHWGRIVDTYDGDTGDVLDLTIVSGDMEGWDTDPESLDRAIDAAIRASSPNHSVDANKMGGGDCDGGGEEG